MPVPQTTLRALKKFPHKGSMVQPGDLFEVPTYRARLFIAPGLAEAPKETKQVKAKKAKVVEVEIATEVPIELDPETEMQTSDDADPDLQTYSTRALKAGE